MLKNLLASIVIVGLLVVQANADFIIDDFNAVDTVANDGNTRLIHTTGLGNIFAEVETGGFTIFGAADNAGYFAQAVAPGDSFTIRYTWDVATFNDLQSVSGNQLTAIPAAFAGSWNLNIDGGAAGNLYNGTALGAPGGILMIDNATQLEFTYSWNAIGAGIGQFGGPGSPLLATPEPTAFIMLGSVGVGALIRRRRKS